MKDKDLFVHKIILKLYVCGMSPRSMQAIENIKSFCTHKLKHAYKLEIIDIYKNPEIAMTDQIVFSPSLIRYWPLPKRVFVGNFFNTEKLERELNIDFNE